MLNCLRSSNCPLCGSTRIAPVGTIAYRAPIRFSSTQIDMELTPELWRCRDCRSGFTQNTLLEEAAKDLYSRGDSTARWTTAPLEERATGKVLAELARLCTQGGSVLDVGANAGDLLDFARARGCVTTGVEYSPAARTELARKGHSVHASLDEAAGGHELITAFDVVEHQYDLSRFLAACRVRLRPGGRLLILTGDIECISARIAGSSWWYAAYPEHIAFPSRRYLERHSGLALERCIATYASPGYRLRRFAWLREMASSVLRGNYQGLPALGPDHVLATLRARTP